MAQGTILAKQFVAGLLTADSTLATYVGTRIYDGLNLQRDTTPIVAYYARRGKPTTGIGGIRILDREWIEVEVTYQKTSPAQETAAIAAAGRIDQLLQNASGVVNGHGISSIQDGSREHPDSTGGVHLWSLCTMWLVDVQSQPY